MGKTSQDSAEQPDDEKKNPPQEKTKENVEEKSEEKKEDVENLRKVIKVDEGEKKDSEPADDNFDTSNREGLEQKRAILQSIKDFDFQIKKNQEELTVLNKRLESVSKDLDDLVSLYEIVSEQMNPFVGLSKVTKKRLDALENFTREIELLKERTGELESFAERSGAKFHKMNNKEQHAETIDTDELLGGSDEETEEEIESSGENVEKNEEEEVAIPETSEEDQEISTEEKDSLDESTTEEEINEVEEELKPTEQIDIQQEFETADIGIESENFEELTDTDIDIIFEEAFGSLSPEGKLDMIIDEFIESLKG